MNIISKTNVQKPEQFNIFFTEIGQILKSKRLFEKINEEEMSKKLFVSRNTLRKFEKNESKDFNLLLDYCNYFDISTGIVVEY